MTIKRNLLLMYESNKNLQDLIKIITEEHLIVFVGAGLSRNLRNANGKVIGGWAELQELLFERINDPNNSYKAFKAYLLEKYSDNPKLILNVIENHPNLNKNIDRILQTYYKVDSSNDFTIQKLIWNISELIITTNYDTALENAYNELYKDVLTIGTVLNAPNCKTIILSRRGLFKLHGDIGSPDTMVVFPSQYDKCYKRLEIKQKKNNDEDETQEKKVDRFLMDFKNLVYNNSFLFLGYGMGDEEIKDILRITYDNFGSNDKKHFIITCDKANDTYLPEYVNKIAVDDYGDSFIKCLENLLEEKKAYQQKNLSNKHYPYSYKNICITIILKKLNGNFIWEKTLCIDLILDGKKMRNLKIPVGIWAAVNNNCSRNTGLKYKFNYEFNNSKDKPFEFEIRENRIRPYVAAKGELKLKEGQAISDCSTLTYNFLASSKYFNPIYMTDIENINYYYMHEKGEPVETDYACFDGVFIEAYTEHLEIIVKYDKSYPLELNKIYPYVTLHNDIQLLDDSSEFYEYRKIEKTLIREESDEEYNVISFELNYPKLNYNYGFLWNPIKKPK